MAMASAITQPERSTVFKSGSFYRIPSLFYDGQHKTLLAFAEERSSPSDTTTEKLVMSRGELKVSDGKKTVEWLPHETVNEAKKHGYRPMNPCVVYDRHNNKLFLFFICIEGHASDWDQIKQGINKTRLCFITSEDLGKTWSELTDLTDKLNSEIKLWSTFAVGPGHGLQTEEGKLIVPVSAFPLPAGNSVPYALSLYSDDCGETWTFGTMFGVQSGECEMAECFIDGESFIYCNARNRGGYRVEALSDDKGKSFKTLKHRKLVETGNGCQGSVVAFPAQESEADSDQKPNKWLLFSHPTDRIKRKNLGVYLNKTPQNPKAWSKRRIIRKGCSGYSDLAYVGDGWFVCLVEAGEITELEQIACQVFHYSEIEAEESHCHLM